jgi:hypothetical protein
LGYGDEEDSPNLRRRAVMKFIGFNVLKKIVKERELSLREVSKLLPKRFKDHRDFYTLASLYTGGYIDSTMMKEEANWDTNKNNLIAELFYTMTFGKGTFKYKGLPFTNDGDFNEEKIFCTAKSDMYFAEQRRKKIDVIVSLFVGIIIAVVSATATVWLQQLVALKIQQL